MVPLCLWYQCLNPEEQSQCSCLFGAWHMTETRENWGTRLQTVPDESCCAATGWGPVNLRRKRRKRQMTNTWGSDSRTDTHLCFSCRLCLSCFSEHWYVVWRRIKLTTCDSKMESQALFRHASWSKHGLLAFRSSCWTTNKTHFSDSIDDRQVSQAHGPEEVEHLGDAGVGWHCVGTRIHVGGDILGAQRTSSVWSTQNHQTICLWSKLVRIPLREVLVWRFKLVVPLSYEG